MVGRSHIRRSRYLFNIGYRLFELLTRPLQTHIAILGHRGLDEFSKKYEPQDLQKAQVYEDKINEAIMMLQTNTDVLTSLRKFYEGLVKSKDFPLGRSCCEDVSAFSTQVNEMIYDSRMHIVRAKLLVRIIADRKTIVCLCFSSCRPSLCRLTLSMY